eukprot:Trichotokara_eunicae@DN555_c0_g1_i2.p1
MLGLGLDFGNETLVAAKYQKGSGADILVNEVSKRDTPSTLAFDKTLRRIGEEAESKASNGHSFCITNIPLLFSNSKNEIKTNFPWRCRLGIENENENSVTVQFGNSEFEISLTHLAAIVIKKMLTYLGDERRPDAICFSVAENIKSDGLNSLFTAAKTILGFQEIYFLTHAQSILNFWVNQHAMNILKEKKLKNEKNEIFVGLFDMGSHQTNLTFVRISTINEEKNLENEEPKEEKNDSTEDPQISINVLASGSENLGVNNIVLALAAHALSK